MIEERFRDALAADPGEMYFLYGLVRALKPEVCLEIGTHKGASAWFIANALNDNNKGHLTTVDPFDYEGTANKISGYPRTTWVQTRGDEIKLDQKIDFAFIDGLHDLDTVDKELANVLPQLADNAVVVFHDAQNEPTNIQAGVNAAVAKHKLKNAVWLPTHFGLRVYCKTVL